MRFERLFFFSLPLVDFTFWHIVVMDYGLCHFGTVCILGFFVFVLLLIYTHVLVSCCTYHPPRFCSVPSLCRRDFVGGCVL